MKEVSIVLDEEELEKFDFIKKRRYIKTNADTLRYAINVTYELLKGEKDSL